MPKAWNRKDIPSLAGKLAIVTGATSGIGYETALSLAESGASVILLGRNEQKGTDALDKIKSICPNTKVSFGKVDFLSLSSVKDFCTEFNTRNMALDILINNAGIVGGNERQVTPDGFETQFITNHLSQFALTALLLPSLRRSSAPRVVNVSSMAARRGKVQFDDLQFEKNYKSMNAYAQTKLANLLFTLELQRQSDLGHWGLTAYTAHPGYCRTEIIDKSGISGIVPTLNRWILVPLFSQSSADGAMPSLYAATSPEAQPGGYYGPNGIIEMRGTVCPAFVPSAAKDVAKAKKLWDISNTLAGVTWP